MKSAFLFASAAVSLALAVPASAATLITEDFNGYSPSVPWSGSGNWSTANSVDLVQSGTYNLTCAGGTGNCVDLTGDRAGTISRVFNLGAGTYRLSFDYTGNQLDGFGGPFAQVGFSAAIGSLSWNSGALANDSTAFLTGGGLFSTDGSPVTLTFSQDLGGDRYRGSILDNVSIASVPEPSIWAMMIIGFGLIGGMLRKSRRQARIVHA